MELAKRPTIGRHPILWLDDLRWAAPAVMGYRIPSGHASLVLADDVPNRDILKIDGQIPLTAYLLQYVKTQGGLPVRPAHTQSVFWHAPPEGLRVRISSADGEPPACSDKTFQLVQPGTSIGFRVMGGRIIFPETDALLVTKKQAKQARVDVKDFWKEHHKVQDTTVSLVGGNKPIVYIDGEPVLTSAMAEGFRINGGSMVPRGSAAFTVDIRPNMAVKKLELLDKLSDEEAAQKENTSQKVIGYFRYPKDATPQWQVAVADSGGTQQVINNQGPLCMPDDAGDTTLRSDSRGERDIAADLARDVRRSICGALDDD